MNVPARMPIHQAIETIDSVARKGKMKVSIGIPGEKEVVLADHRSDAPDAQILLDLEDMTKRNVDELAKLVAKIKQLTEMIHSALLNDDAYRKATEELKALTKQRAVIQYSIINQPVNKKLVEQLKEMKSQKKELTATQSDYLREYARMSGSTQLELFDGTVMELVATYKLIKPSKR